MAGKYTDEQKAAALKDLAEGWSQVAVGKKHGVPTSTLRAWHKRANMKPKARRSNASRTPTKNKAFFDALSSGSTVGAACEKAGYTRSNVYRWREEDSQFAAAWDDADEAAVERMEAEADRRAIEGTDKPVFHRGEQCGIVREFSDTLLIFRLKAKRPAVYRERFEHSGPNGKELAGNTIFYVPQNGRDESSRD